MRYDGSNHKASRKLSRRTFLAGSGALLAISGSAPVRALSAVQTSYNLLDFGAKGDGITLDSAALNRAIGAAADAGGGYVDLPAGRYLCFTIHLRSHVTLRFAPGSVIIAAYTTFSSAAETYDPPEPQLGNVGLYQDYGHNHWHNSLFWGENLEDVALIGQGELWGRGLEKGDGPAEERPGSGNKVIALKGCNNVLLRDLAIRSAGHFGVLATAVDNLTIENVRIDTVRDGIDIDSCHNVHIHSCNVNSPWDDAIVLKSSYSLGELRSTEQVTISDCIVTGNYQLGSMLDGTDLALGDGPLGDKPSHVGRIKIGTETNGDIRNVAVTNCVFEGCHGLAVISEDGGTVEDVLFSNITMRNLVGPPIFVRLGGRMREPAPAKASTIRRIGFHQIDCVSAASDDCSIIAGIPGHLIEDITVADLWVRHPGGGKARTAAIPEQIAAYPEPHMFGPTPAYGFYLRHAEQLSLRHILVDPEAPDARPLVWMDDVQNASFDDVRCTGNAAAQIGGVHTAHISVTAPQT